MTLAEMWGVVFVAYIAPFAVWALVCLALEKPVESDVWIWTAGLLGILTLQVLGVPPGFGLLLGAGVLLGIAGRRVHRWWSRYYRRSVRYLGP